MDTRQRIRRLSRLLMAIGVMWVGLSLAGCDFDVSNPGPVEDEYLNDPEAFQAVVNGMGRAMAEGMNYIAFHGTMPPRELFPTGGTGQYGISVNNGDGFLNEDEQNTPWSTGQRARWLAEEGLRRFRSILDEAGFNSSPEVAMAYLWAGYANRALGENMCEAVIDNGPAQPREEFLHRAEEHLTNAITVGSPLGRSDLVTAAYAARAAVRVQQGDWAAAVADAGQVPTSFVFKLQYYDLEADNGAQRNRIAYAGGAAPFKTHSVWGTYYQQYYTDTQDPRTPWVDTGVQGDGAVECCGPIRFLKQLKYEDFGADMNLSSGREMRLIEAEALLRADEWQEAMQIVNSLRADVGVPPWPASNTEEAWARLKRERGIELWLEGRRLGDLRRWQESNTPGALDPLEMPGQTSHLLAQDLCFPISLAERQTNPNLQGS